MKLRKILSNIITLILFIVFILMLFVFISSKAVGGEPQIFGYQLKTVLSGSMEPGIKTGSIIVVKPGGDMTRFKKGDVITYKMDETMLITHRIVEVNKSADQVLYRTKGDHNKTEDMNPVLSQNVVAEYTGFTIPYLGYFVNVTNTKNGAFLLIVPGVLILVYSIVSLWKTVAQLDPKKSKNSTDSGKSL